MVLSLRGQLFGGAALLGVLALGVAAALVGITTRMERGSAQLWQAFESVRAAEELEVALLVHARERRLLEASEGEARHTRGMQAAEVQLRHWMEQARRHPSGAEETALLAQLEAEVAAYLAGVSTQPDAFTIERSLALSERLVDFNAAQASVALAELQRWNHTADLLGLATALALLGGVAALLWSAQRFAYRPLMAISRALGGFRLGSRRVPAPESGARELRDMARQFNEMAARLERQREQQLAFLAGVAHDLRNPLQALRLAVSSSAALTPEKALERLALVRRQVQRFERMVEDLLDTARVEGGQLELQVAEQDLSELVRESVELHRPLSALHHLEAQLPEGPVRARCDATRVLQVLNNLLSNAIKYSPGGGTIRVRLESGPEGPSLSVRDPGMGIPEAEQQSIFEPFRRSATTRGTIPGVGLGLSVARRIVEAHGGRLEVTSAPGEGSTFRVRLPRTEEADASASATGG